VGSSVSSPQRRLTSSLSFSCGSPHRQVRSVPGPPLGVGLRGALLTATPILPAHSIACGSRFLAARPENPRAARPTISTPARLTVLPEPSRTEILRDLLHLYPLRCPMCAGHLGLLYPIRHRSLRHRPAPPPSNRPSGAATCDPHPPRPQTRLRSCDWLPRILCQLLSRPESWRLHPATPSAGRHDRDGPPATCSSGPGHWVYLTKSAPAAAACHP